jgi:hypothetical protein
VRKYKDDGESRRECRVQSQSIFVAGVPAKIMEATKYRNKKFHTKKIGSGFCVLGYLSVGEWECNPTIVENAPVGVLNVVKTCHCPTKIYSFAEVF